MIFDNYYEYEYEHEVYKASIMQLSRGFNAGDNVRCRLPNLPTTPPLRAPAKHEVTNLARVTFSLGLAQRIDVVLAKSVETRFTKVAIRVLGARVVLGTHSLLAELALVLFTFDVMVA